MAMTRIDWGSMPVEVRGAVERRIGAVKRASTAQTGSNSELAAVVESNRGRVFLKGIRLTGHGAVRQQREAAVNPYVQAVSPKLQWSVQEAGWHLLAFAYVDGRHPDYTPGSPDLPAVIDTMNRLGSLPAPKLPEMKTAVKRWGDYTDRPDLLAGTALLHTDWANDNVMMVDNGRAQLIDWAWPTHGAGFIDPACLLVRLIAAGHSPEQGEALMSRCGAWRGADPKAIDVFAGAVERVWAEIASAEPLVDWKQDMANAAASWAEHRCGLKEPRA